MRERWGTFSVRNHMSKVNKAPFVSDVLLYDRLIIPVPPADNSQLEFWAQFEPERQQSCLKILKVKTEKKDGLALTVPWDAAKRERFKNRMSTAAALATQQRSPEQGHYLDPFEMTKDLIKEEFRPALPRGVAKSWTVAAYTSADAFRKDDPDRRRQLAAMIRHRFLTPAGSDPEHELLKRAVDLANKPDFRSKRADFYAYQENVIEERIPAEKAIEELENLLNEYNEATRKAFRNVIAKYVFTVIPIGLTITGSLLAGAGAPLFLAGAAGLIGMARFYEFDRKPVIEAGDLDSAAMIHHARKELLLK
jgi:hypothetical protein